jgi:hypothetical protein
VLASCPKGCKLSCTLSGQELVGRVSPDLESTGRKDVGGGGEGGRGGGGSAHPLIREVDDSRRAAEADLIRTRAGQGQSCAGRRLVQRPFSGKIDEAVGRIPEHNPAGPTLLANLHLGRTLNSYPIGTPLT